MSEIASVQSSMNVEFLRPLRAVAARPPRRDLPKQWTTFDDDGPHYVLPELAYPVDALEPYCSAETLRIHHDRQHAAYVTGANRICLDSGVGCMCALCTWLRCSYCRRPDSRCGG